MKVIHVIESLKLGAVEHWLVRVLRHARNQGREIEWTFYCTLNDPGSLEGDALDLGADVLTSPVPQSNQLSFLRELRATLKRGRYDVLHCHHDLVSGLYLLAAFGLPIRRRIVHVHNAGGSVLTPNPWKQAIYKPLLRAICMEMSDHIVAVSHSALQTFLNGRPRHPDRDLVQYCGVDPRPFLAAPFDRDAFRAEIGIPAHAQVLLFGGRLVPEKNPLLVVDLLSCVKRQLPSAVAVFAGSGPLLSSVLERARAMHVHEAVYMLGWRPDLPALMRAADCFILPASESPMEGFGLSVLEAQLAGLPVLISRGVPDDPLLPTAAFRRVPLAAPAATWAQAAMELLAAPKPCQVATMAAFDHSRMNLDHSTDELFKLYNL